MTSRAGALLLLISTTALAAELTIQTELNAADCQKSKAARFTLQLREVTLRAALQTVANVTCFTFVIDPGAEARVTIHPSDDGSIPEWSSDQVFAAVVEDLAQQGVVVKADGPNRYRVKAAPPCVPAERIAQFTRSVKRTGEHQYDVPRSELVGIAREMNCVSGKLSMVRSFKDGKVRGHTLDKIMPGSIPAALGLRDRDIVLAVLFDGEEKNDEPITQFSRASKVTLLLDRGGKPARVDLILK